MKRGHLIATKVVILSLGFLLAAGCNKPPPPNTAPTAFFDSCVAEKFSVKSPQQGFVAHSLRNIASGELGSAEYSGILANPVLDDKGLQIGWKACMTNEECARKLYQAIIKEPRRAAEDKGITLQGKEGHDDKAFTWTYRKGSNDGTLEGKYELSDTMEMSKDVKAYFLKLKLREVIHKAP